MEKDAENLIRLTEGTACRYERDTYGELGTAFFCRKDRRQQWIKTDYRILRILKENGRESASLISEREIHLSIIGSTGPDKKLEDSGVIKSYN